MCLPVTGKSQLRNQLLRRFRRFIRHGKQHLCFNAVREKLVVYILHDHVAFFQNVPAGKPFAVHADLHRTVLFKPAETAQKCGFACAVPADQTDDAAPRQPERRNGKRVFFGMLCTELLFPEHIFRRMIGEE